VVTTAPTPPRGTLPVVSEQSTDPGSTERTELMRPVTLPPVDELPDPSDAQPTEPGLQKLSVIGRGGMGRVHVARDPVLRREVALKELRRSRSRTAERRFVTEAQVTAQLEHPHIVPVYGCDLHSDPQSYSMKLVRGTTLTQVIERSAVARRRDEEVPDDLALPTLLDHFAKVCDALAYAHDKGVVHRDLKPDNIMVGDHGQVYVMDWGLARVRGAADILDLPTMRDMTLPGYAIGSVGYMAPEQALGQPMGPACDQYALGLILFEMLGGRRARPRPDDIQIALERAAAGTLRPLKPLDADTVPDGLVDIVRRATRADPDERFASVQALADELRRVRQPPPPATRPERGGATLRLGIVATSTLALAAMLTLAILGSAGMLALGLRGATPAPDPAPAQTAQAPVTPAAPVGPSTAVLREAATVQERRATIEHQVHAMAAAVRATLRAEPPEASVPTYAPEAFADPEARPPDARRMDALDTWTSSTWPDLALPDGATAAARAQARQLTQTRDTLQQAVAATGARWARVVTETGVLLTLPGSSWQAEQVDLDGPTWAQQRDRSLRWMVGATDHHGQADQLVCSLGWPASDGLPAGAVALIVDPRTLVPEPSPGQLQGPGGLPVAGRAPNGGQAIPLPGGWSWRPARP